MANNDHRSSLASLIARTMTDDAYRAEVLADPRAAMQAAGMPVPDNVSVTAIEQAGNTHVFIIPARVWTSDGTPKDNLIHTLTTDAATKARFIDDPRAVLKEHGIDMPDSIDITVIVNTPESKTIALPAKIDGPTELTDAELAMAAGGKSHHDGGKSHHDARGGALPSGPHNIPTAADADASDY